MKKMEMNDSYLRFDDPSMLSNLQEIVLGGKTTWENLQNFGSGLTGIRNLKLVFDCDIEQNFENIHNLAQYLPGGHKLETLSIVYKDKDFMSVLSKVLEHQIDAVAK